MLIKTSWKDFGVFTVIMAFATLVSFFFISVTSKYEIVAIVYVLATFLISRYTIGYLWGTLSSIGGVVAMNYFFTYPYFQFDFLRVGYPITFIGMFTISAITSTMTSNINQQKQHALDREHLLEKLNQFNNHLLLSKTSQEMLTLSVDYLSAMNHSSVYFYSTDQSESGISSICHLIGSDTIRLFKTDGVQKQIAAHNSTTAWKSYEENGYYYSFLLISSSEHCWGTIIICSRSKNYEFITLELNQLIISQIALSLDHYALSEHHHKLILESEKEKMRSNLLRAVSHDLRTPLTGMIGASSTYLEAKDYLDDYYKDKLISGIYEDANWLLNMVENLLSVTRIQQESTTVNKTPESLEEVVSEALVRFQKRYPDIQLHVQIPDEMLMVPMDATLIEQVIINLLENAAVHAKSEQPTDFIISCVNDIVSFHVRDYGEGISKERLPYLFDGCPHSDNDKNDNRKGMGIGLSICKTIILAHQGRIDAINHENGAEFFFTLPL